MNKLTRIAGKTAGGNVGRSMLAASMSVAAIAASVTGAYFTDSDAIGSNAFATGTVALSTNPTTNAMSMSTMAPGDVQYGTVTVTNNGSLQARYALKSVTSEDTLAAQLDLTVWNEAAETDTDTTCSQSAVPATTLYAPADLGQTTGVNILGDATQGQQTGDRLLAAGGSETLCFKVNLPLDSGNSFQNLNTTATFTFNSEQVANNA